ncbi:MAG: alpha/beta hydrolase, partial [Clostridiales bacterium]|nr:alpha/beta hydrolase [Clostridiales bacterium]
GRVILKMTEREPLPCCVDKILFVDSAGVMPVRSKKQNFRTKIYKLGKKLLSIYPIKKMFPNALEALKKKFSSADYANASEIMRGVLVKTVNEDLVHLMKNIKCQTLLIWGENDTATPVCDAKIFEREISSAGTDVGLALIKNAGHYSFLDQPYVFSNIIKSFLKI